MVKLAIDQREVEVPPGATILDAARQLGIEIPTLCFLEGCRPSTSCLACVVKHRGTARFVPSCATVAVEGMDVESETPEVHQARKSALELLLSDHLGDCLGPCHLVCPAQMNIPQMLRQIASGQLREAIATVKNDIALPAVLGRICPAPCESACRRKPAAGAVSICLLKRYVADVDIAASDRYLPSQKPASGKRVAIVGAGPTGLSAAYYLLAAGHACTILDAGQLPGGRLLTETDPNQLPRETIQADIAPILELGAKLRMNTAIVDRRAFDDLLEKFDAVLVAGGAAVKDRAESWGLRLGKLGIEIDKRTFQTHIEGVFAAGNAIRGKGLVVRSAGDGKEVAASIDQYLAGRAVTGPARPFNTRIGRVEPAELQEFLIGAAEGRRQDPTGGLAAGFAADEAAEQAARCLHCDCRAAQDCKLRKYSAAYDADPRRYPAPRRTFHQDVRNAAVIFEPGKCIDCGLCIEIATAAGEPLGLTFIGRGFDVRIGVPFDRSLAESLSRAAAQCAAACPTAALSLR